MHQQNASGRREALRRSLAGDIGGLLERNEAERLFVGTHFEVLTDHQNLKWIFKCNESLLGRYAAALSQCDMDIKYRKGPQNNADGVSRAEIPSAEDTRRVFAIFAR